MNDLQKRKPIRLEEYDYSDVGAYFVTICTKNRENILWETTAKLQPNNDMVIDNTQPVNNAVIDNTQPNAVGAVIGRPYYNHRLNELGLIVEKYIKQIPQHYKHVNVDNYVVMPNHVHLLLSINEISDNGRPMTAPTLSWIINQFKGACSKQIGYSIWQKSFYDHVIRTQRDYAQIWQYIDENPLKWESDEYYEQ